MNLIARARPVLIVGSVVAVIGFALMFMWPVVGIWIALPGMAVVAAGGLLAFGVLLASLFGKRVTND